MPTSDYPHLFPAIADVSDITPTTEVYTQRLAAIATPANYRITLAQLAQAMVDLGLITGGGGGDAGSFDDREYFPAVTGDTVTATIPLPSNTKKIWVFRGGSLTPWVYLSKSGQNISLVGVADFDNEDVEIITFT